MESIINVQFFEHLGLFLCLFIGLTGFKIVTCSPFTEGGEQFDWGELKRGSLKNLVVSLCVSLVYSAGSIWGKDLIVISVEGTQLTIQAAIDVMLLSAIAVYGAKFVGNFAEMIGIGGKKKVEPAEQRIIDGEKIKG